MLFLYSMIALKVSMQLPLCQISEIVPLSLPAFKKMTRNFQKKLTFVSMNSTRMQSEWVFYRINEESKT